MLHEVVTEIDPRSNGVYIDATCGGGGHAEALLEASSPHGRVLAADRDPVAIERTQARLRRFGERVTVELARFSQLSRTAQATHAPVDGVVADLGVSAFQLDDPGRGFSFRADAPLDMRMGPDATYTAKALLESVDEPELAQLLRDFGEVPGARRVARSVVAARDAGELETTGDLARAVDRVAPRPRKGWTKIRPATRVFQAIRIAINDELVELAELLRILPDLVKPGGRVAIISFHSLEDRLVKRAFRKGQPEAMPPGWPVEPVRPIDRWRPLTPKPLLPAAIEVERNPRARSAKLRVAERTEGEGDS